MDFLLDTHTFIWFFNGDKLLSKKARTKIEDLKSKKFVSIVSIWEVAIKIGLKKLYFDGGTNEVAELIEQNGFQLIPISIAHTNQFEILPFIHRDPFDRMLVAQAMIERMTIITVDDNIQKYEIKTYW